MNSAFENFLRTARVLVVDDEPANVLLLERLLEGAGLTAIRTTTDSRTALALFSECDPDLVLLDLMMPHLDGFEVLELLRGVIAPDSYQPVMILTADVSPRVRRRALAAGARDFLCKPLDATELELRVRNLLEARFLHLGLQAQNTALEDRVAERTGKLESALRELRESQRQALQQERLHAFSTMAAGVVHDFNNNLMVLQGFTEMLRLPGALQNEAKAQRDLALISRAVGDAAHVVSRLRQFYRPRTGEETYAPVLLWKLVEEVGELARPRWRDEALGAGCDIELRTEVPADLQVRGIAAELREALLNLVFNAVDAMPDGGSITLRACLCENGDAVRLEVADTGLGMTEEVRVRCLEPFFTTKGEDGTGLGLAMVFGIVRRHEGGIEIESAPGRGTTFALTLPREHSNAAQAQHFDPATLAPLRVLFADDDANIRELIAHVLELYGHQVTVAADGSEALERFQLGKFDVLLTDLSMPRMTGTALAAAVKRLAPDLPVVMLTGFGSMLLPDGSPPPDIDMLLDKPITPSALAMALARATERTPVAA